MTRLVDSSDEQRTAFAAALEAYLQRAKMRPADLRRALQAAGFVVHQPSISRWMSGEYEPGRAIVIEMERALDLAPGLLARTLGWLPLDAVAMTVGDVESAIIADERLSADQRQVLLAAYRSLVDL